MKRYHKCAGTLRPHKNFSYSMKQTMVSFLLLSSEIQQMFEKCFSLSELSSQLFQKTFNTFLLINTHVTLSDQFTYTFQYIEVMKTRYLMNGH